MALHHDPKQLLHLWFFLASLVVSLSHNKATLVLAKNDDTSHHNGHDKLWDHYQVNWDESHGSFVPYPEEAHKLLESRHRATSAPVLLDVVSHVADWDQPLFAILKGIVHRNHRVNMSPHFFVQDGSTAACHTKPQNRHDAQRRLRLHERWLADDKDDDEEFVDTPVSAAAPLPENCTRHCTNHGRYCLEHSSVAGAELIQEAARRMCFEYLLKEAGSEEMFQYIEGFQSAQCHKQGDGKIADCSRKVLKKTHSALTEENMERCLNEGGVFDKDEKNLELEQQLEYQQQLKLPQTIQQAASTLPVMEINGKPYTGHYTVEDIFQAVCDAFPENGKPVACDFCGACSDVRKCLWKLECDGEPFDTILFLGAVRRGTLPPLQDNAEIEGTSKSSSSLFLRFGSPSGWEVGFVWGLAGGLIIAAFFMIRELKSRRLAEEKVHRGVVEDLSWQPEPLGLPDLNNVSEALNAGPLGSGPLGSIEESDSEDEDEEGETQGYRDEEFQGYRDEEEPSSTRKRHKKKKKKNKTEEAPKGKIVFEYSKRPIV